MKTQDHRLNAYKAAVAKIANKHGKATASEIVDHLYSIAIDYQFGSIDFKKCLQNATVDALCLGLNVNPRPDKGILIVEIEGFPFDLRAIDTIARLVE